MKKQDVFVVTRRMADMLFEGFFKLAMLKDGKTGEINDYEIVDLNRQAEITLNIQRSEVIGKSIFKVLPVVADCWDEIFEKLVGLGE